MKLDLVVLSRTNWEASSHLQHEQMYTTHLQDKQTCEVLCQNQSFELRNNKRTKSSLV